MQPEQWLQNLAVLEGLAVTDVPGDHGGLTGAMGVTQAAYDRARARLGLPLQSVVLMTTDEAIDLYQHDYWVPGYCDQLPDPLDFTHFQWVVNHGPNGAAITLQKALGVQQDGLIGSETLIAARTQDVMVTCQNYLIFQRAWYHDRVKADPTQNKFLQGWINRTIRVSDIINSRPLSV